MPSATFCTRFSSICPCLLTDAATGEVNEPLGPVTTLSCSDMLYWPLDAVRTTPEGSCALPGGCWHPASVKREAMNGSVALLILLHRFFMVGLRFTREGRRIPIFAGLGAVQALSRSRGAS